MVKQHDLGAPPGAHRRSRRVGRGDGSGRGSYSGRGQKGQGARSGNGKQPPGFEGNQLALVRRLPTLRGFTNHFRTDYATINLGQLEERAEAGQQVTPEWLAAQRLVDNANVLVKVLGGGELTKALQISAHRFSQSARQKLEQAGGAANELPLPRSAKKK
ncbi:MAG: 50S ribosomal protein L15 [Dehalococcoidia bacterium]|nr:50S ribosomal protein L15 [Dehalococcoidia bacterium]